MTMGEEIVHVLLISFPGQGHVNPLLRLAKRLASKGLLVTFSTTEAIGLMINKATDNKTTADADTPTSIGKGKLRFEFFSDGWDINDPTRNDLDALMDQLPKAGSQAIADLIARQSNEGRPVSCVINNPFMPWVLDVATDAGIPCAMLWVQSCAVFSAYYHYFYQKVKYPASIASDINLQLPGMPVLTPAEVPSFLLEENPYMCLTEVILNQFKNMSKASWVMVDSFHELERPVIESLEGLSSIIPVGPLLKSIQASDSSSVRGDMWKASDCMEWLDSRPPSSVLYVSLGSVVVLEKAQMEELAWGIRNSGRPFLWVVKPMVGATETGLPEGFSEETAEKGLMVQWCPQDQVLQHPSVACFLTHCGWNSSMESLSFGVPTIGFPQWGDQVTNAKFLADVYGVGVRLKREEDRSLVSKEEVERCIAEVMDGGPRSEEIKKNAMKWKKAAADAVSEGGSSDRNIQAFVDDIKRKMSANKVVAAVDVL